MLRRHSARIFVGCCCCCLVSVSAFLTPKRICKTHPRLFSSVKDDSATQIITAGRLDVEEPASSSFLKSSSESVLHAADLEEESSLSITETIMKDASPDRKSNKDVMALWKRRLITFEDVFSVHKLSAVVYTLSSFALIGTAAQRWLVGRQELFAIVPDYLEPVMWVMTISNFFLCSASIRMAWLYRSNNVASRNAFIGVAGSSLFSTYFLVWASPFAPEEMITPLASQIGFGILCAWNIILILDTMIRAKDIIHDRRDKRSQEEDESYVLEYLRYIVSAAWPLPVIASTGYISSVLHDHAYVMSVFDQVLKTDGLGLQASVFYNNVGGSMAAAYGAFFITLRDKLLISKRAEWIGIACFSVPVLVWTIDVSARFFPYVLRIAQLDQ